MTWGHPKIRVYHELGENDYNQGMTSKKTKFIPFNAINEFMLPEYRQKLLQTVFINASHLSEERQANIHRLVKKLVIVPGFRNSPQAPAGLKARSAISAFERSADFTAQIIQAWFELNEAMAEKTFNFLTERGWKLLPVESDRSKLPGLLTRWPENDTFEVLDNAFNAANPDSGIHEYDLNMMFVWLSGRLPVDMVPEGEITQLEDSAEL